MEIEVWKDISNEAGKLQLDSHAIYIIDKT